MIIDGVWICSYEDRPESRLRLVDCRIRVSFNMERSTEYV